MASSSARNERKRATKRPARFEDEDEPHLDVACDDQGLEHEREEYIYIKYKEDGIEEVVPVGYLRTSKDGWKAYHAASKAWFEAVVIERNESKKDLLKKKKAASLRLKKLQKEKVQEEKSLAKEKKEKAKEEKALAKEKKVKEKEDKERAKAILEARDQLILSQMANYQSYDIDVPEAVARSKKTIGEARKNMAQTTLEGRILDRLEECETEELQTMEEEVPMEEEEDDDDYTPYHHTRPLPGTFAKPACQLPASQFQTQPARPIPTQPARLIQTTPARLIQTTPARPTPTTPACLIQTTPARPTKTTPARPTQTTPARPTQTTPARLTQTTHARPTPTTPAWPIQTIPARPTQTTPASLIQTTSLSTSSRCAQCIIYRARIEELERRSELAIESSARPKSGKMSKSMAAEHNMVEVSPGTGVFTYEHNLSAALQKKSATFAATFLLNCFYTNTELLEHGYSGLDTQVVASIIAFASNAKGGRVVEIRQAIRSKMEGLKFRSKKKCKAAKSP